MLHSPRIEKIFIFIFSKISTIRSGKQSICLKVSGCLTHKRVSSHVRSRSIICLICSLQKQPQSRADRDEKIGCNASCTRIECCKRRRCAGISIHGERWQTSPRNGSTNISCAVGIYLPCNFVGRSAQLNTEQGLVAGNEELGKAHVALLINFVSGTGGPRRGRRKADRADGDSSGRLALPPIDSEIARSTVIASTRKTVDPVAAISAIARATSPAVDSLRMLP